MEECAVSILYLSPGACSLAGHIAPRESGIAFRPCNVDLKSKATEDGRDFRLINPKGYVPTLELDGGERLTDNIAILSWIAGQAPALKPGGLLADARGERPADTLSPVDVH